MDEIIKQKHCMLDTETLGVNSNSPIIQIGVAFFTLDGIYLRAQFSLDFNEACKYGEVDGSTIEWWLKQPKEAQNALFNNVMGMDQAIDAFTKLIEGQAADQYWAHATFDFPIIKSLFTKMNRQYPINFRRSFDLRTLEYLAGNPEWDPRTSTHHNALEDAVYQAEHAIKLLKLLGRG